MHTCIHAHTHRVQWCLFSLLSHTHTHTHTNTHTVHETSSLSAVPTPEAKHKLKLPSGIILHGLLTTVQCESILLACAQVCLFLHTSIHTYTNLVLQQVNERGLPYTDALFVYILIPCTHTLTHSRTHTQTLSSDERETSLH